MTARIIVLGLLMAACLPAHAEVVSGIIYGIGSWVGTAASAVGSFVGTYGAAISAFPTIGHLFIRRGRK